MTVSAEERRFIRRALGLDRDLIAQKNYYAAQNESDVLIGDGLAARGLAKRRPQSPGSKITSYNITFAGFRAVCERGERLSDSVFNLMQWREAFA